MNRFFLLLAALALPLAGHADTDSSTPADAPAAEAIIREAMDNYRGLTSFGEMSMTIHRPDWERSMTMLAWTEGDERTLVRVTEPRKDSGNGTLTDDGNMWTFAPRINRIIKIPSSMMNQNWMGSDFSNKDVSKSADIVDQYDHSLLEVREEQGHKIYVIESVPHEEAAVVWGREVVVVRDDWVILEQQFWDQAGVQVKAMRALEIKQMDGRAVATVVRMAHLERPEEWTELRTLAVDFDIELPEGLFTLSSLRNPRQ